MPNPKEMWNMGSIQISKYADMKAMQQINFRGNQGQAEGTIMFFITQRHIDTYLKNSVSKSIVLVIKHAKFQLYRVHPDGVI